MQTPTMALPRQLSQFQLVGLECEQPPRANEIQNAFDMTLSGSHLAGTMEAATQATRSTRSTQNDIICDLRDHVKSSHIQQDHRDQKIEEISDVFVQACQDIGDDGNRVFRTMNEKMLEGIRSIDIKNLHASKTSIDALLHISEHVADSTRARTLQALEDQRRVFTQQVDFFFDAKRQEHQSALAASSEVLAQCQLQIQKEVDVAKDVSNHNTAQCGKVSDVIVQHHTNMVAISKCATPGCSQSHAKGYIHCCRTCASTKGNDHGPVCKAKHRPCATWGCSRPPAEGYIHCCRPCAMGQGATSSTRLSLSSGDS